MKHVPMFALYITSFIVVMFGRDDFAMTWHCGWMMGCGVFIGMILSGAKNDNH